MSNRERRDQNITDKMRIEYHQEFPIPKEYNIPERIRNSIEGSEIKPLHFNKANDVYRGVHGIILVNKKGSKYDKIEISGDVETNKSLVEKLLGEKIGN